MLKNVKSKIKGNSNYSYLFDKAFNKKNTIVAKEAVQSYVAGILLKPAKSKKIGDFVPGGLYYDETFNDKTPVDPRCYLFPYAVTYYGKNILLHKKDDRQRASNLLFTTVYFRIVLTILKKIGIVSDDVNNISEINGFADIFDVIFKNADINKRLLDYADQILIDQIFDDTAINEMIGDNLPKFLKNTVENQKCTKIIEDKIENRINKPNMQTIIEEIKTIYNVEG